ncbi:MAG: hypothetical protein JNM31_10365 [Flavobacteriales bacterium]|nr:hypothetical protein [Flavobacteriales bacterium]
MSAPLVRTFFFQLVRALLLVAFILSGGMARAQLLDSIGGFLGERPRFLVTLDTRGSFISNQNVRLLGVKVGLEHSGRVRYGVGYSFLSTPVSGGDRVVEWEGGSRMVATRLRFGYITPFFSYAFYQRGHWEVSIPVQVGLGWGALVYTSATGKNETYASTFVFLYEPAMVVQYRFLRYLAVGGGWGFRLVATGADLDQSLNAPIYLFGLKVYFGDILRDLRREEP